MDVIDHLVDAEVVMLITPILLWIVILALLKLGAVDLAKEVKSLDDILEIRVFVLHAVQKEPVTLLKQRSFSL